jgi:2-keto-3-deoxy-L-rhamnonate aldolase RhmA
MSPNRLKRDLAAGKVCLGAAITIESPAVAEIRSHIVPDWRWIEMEHSVTGDGGVHAMLQATNGAGVSTMVRGLR